MKRKRWAVWLIAMALAVTSVPVHAAAGSGNAQAEGAIQTEGAALTEEATLEEGAAQSEEATLSEEVTLSEETTLSEGTILTEDVTLTEEDWYDSLYFREPEQRYPKPGIREKGARDAILSLEESVVSQMEGLPDRIDVSAYKIPVSQAGAPYFQILNNHPEFFYVEKSTSYSYSGGYILSYSVRYRMDKAEIPRCRQELEREVDLAVARVDSSLSDVEKALAVHDYLALHCEYDLDRLNSNSLPAISHTAYGALVNRMAVCDGYAGAFAYIMKSRFGVPCTMVSSSGMAHAWNMIQIANQWYHVDVTWDDPTRDLIGRAGHSYFLISDSVISDSSHKHYGWESAYQATSTAYSNAFWTGVDSAVIYHQGAWYYSKYDASGRKVNLMKRSSLLSGAETAVYAADLWGTSTSYYPSSYMYLDQANGKLYFSTKSDLRRLNGNGTSEVVYRPSVPANHCIYGFTIRGSQLCYAIQNTPNLSAKQNVQTYTLAELEEPVILEITGITAEDVQAVYDGKAKQIHVKGTWEGDVVRYALEGQASYSASQPEMVDAGTYRVSYRVERSGYQAFTGTATVTIAKAVPQYSIPSGLKGSSGKTLASIALPSGFAWQTAADTKLSQEGTFTYLVTYVPSDTKNYQQVSDIQVSVTVSCPGHQYASEVTKEPTTSEEGIRTYTCALCGHTYTEVIEKLTMSAITGVKAENVQAVYDGKAKAIDVTGTQAGDVVTYALADGKYSASQPEMVDAGTYQVSYRVERSGHQAFEGSAVVEITQAIPQYTAPSGLEGSSGKTLASITLSDGFTWQTAADTKLSQEGTFTYLVTYVPSDTKNYQEVSDIQVEVKVSCPGHQYSMTVTKEPTAAEKGERLYTCKICGHTYTEEIEKLDPSLPLIEGVHAQDVKKTYDGVSAAIEIEGLSEGDSVLYAGADGAFASSQPEMVDAGTYQITYRVERSGFQPFTGTATVTIAKAVPQYTAPNGLEGSSGKTLADIALPDGFAWQTAANTKLSQEGTFTYLVTYVPSDTKNYQEVSNIQVKVTVSCPGHRYRSAVTQSPTTVKKGLRTYTCTICGLTYTEEIPMLTPQKPANVSGQKVAKATATSLKFTWKKASGVRYELTLSQGKKKASAKDTSSNSVTFTKLKSGTEYSLKIRPYRKADGRKVYAVKSATIKAATAPAQAKLSSLRKSGNKKARLAWKKASGANGYEVYMRTGNGSYKKIKTITNAKTVSLVKSALKKGKTYTFRVRAYKKLGSTKIYGAYSSAKSIKIK